MGRGSTGVRARVVRHLGGRRTRLTVGVAAVAILGAACFPLPLGLPTPVSQFCAASTPTTPAAYQAAFNGLRRTYTEWVSADGAVPVNLPDGRRVYMFGDTYVGTANAAGAVDPSDPIVNNSFVVQNGPCFAPLMGGAPHLRGPLIPGPGPNEWYWPAAGVVENSSTLRVIVWHILRGTGGSLNFQPVDMRVATFSLPSLTLQSVQALPIPTSVDHPYGSTVLEASDGYLYLFGRDNNRDQFVARVPQAEGLMAAATSYQFWSGDTTQWQSDPTKAVPLAFNNMPALLPQLGSGVGPAAALWVLPYQGGYLATAKPAEIFSGTVSVFTATQPQGPWTWKEDVAITPPTAGSGVPDESGLGSYGAYTLTPSGTPVVVYNTNQFPGISNPPTPTIYNYGPQFVTPTNPLPSIP
jgi:hypothetical protein